MIKKSLFYIVLIAVNVFFVELIAYGFYRVKYGDYARQDLQLERIRTINSIQQGAIFTGENPASASPTSKSVREVLHPYTGYTVEAVRSIEGCLADEAKPYQCLDRDLRPEDSPMPKRSDQVLNVAILGGSVAVGTVNGAPHRYYQKKLQALPEYEGRDVVVHLLAAGGYRQPQPLMMLNYYQTLGAEYDIVISLDGFNEIAIAGSEFKWNQIHPAFPRSWKHRLAGNASAGLINLQAEKVALQKRHTGRATFLSNPIVRNSATFNLLWKIMHSNYQGELTTINEQISYFDAAPDKPRKLQFEGVGPVYKFSDWDSTLKYAAELWANSTLLSYGAAQVQGANFFHFIQPNQYIEGAKSVMSEAERRIAIAEPGSGKGGYGAWYIRGYPFLKERQQWLQGKGINTVDLTYLYKNEPGDIYIDSCCHVNTKGSAMIVDAIVQEIHRYNSANPE